MTRAIIWEWLCETTSAAARAAHLALPFVLGLLSRSFCCAVSAVQHGHIRFYFLFLTSMFAGSFMGHFENTMVPYLQLQKLHFENIVVPYRQVNIYVGMRLPRNTRAFSNFSQCGYCYLTNTNLLMVGRTNTYIHTPLLAQSRPNYNSCML